MNHKILTCLLLSASIHTAQAIDQRPQGLQTQALPSQTPQPHGLQPQIQQPYGLQPQTQLPYGQQPQTQPPQGLQPQVAPPQFILPQGLQPQNKQPKGVYLVDVVIYRPLGLIATIVGTAVFVAISPLTALTAISRPHDAFEKTAQLLIINPANFTFDRPLGVYYADPDGRYRRH